MASEFQLKTSNRLARLQLKIAAAMRNQDDLNEASNLFESKEPLSNIERLSIYRDNINAGFINTLKTTYPVCNKLVGDEFFSAMCYRYLKSASSTSPDLNNYGEDFPDFIATFPHAQQLPYLSDVAKLEWYWHRCNFFKKNRVIAIEKLSGLTEQELRHCEFKLADDAILFTSDYPIFEIWATNTSTDAEEKIIELDDNKSQLIIFRDQDERRIDILNDEQYFLLATIKQQLSFGELCEQYLQNNFSTSFQESFSHCCVNGWLDLADTMQ